METNNQWGIVNNVAGWLKQHPGRLHVELAGSQPDLFGEQAPLKVYRVKAEDGESILLDEALARIHGVMGRVERASQGNLFDA